MSKPISTAIPAIPTMILSMHTNAEQKRLAAEFDAIAALEETYNHNAYYHAFLFRNLPARMDTALDVGCGKGDFAALLQRRARRVTGLDLSPAMLRGARAVCPAGQFLRADLLAAPFQKETFDVVVSIATLHHVPLGDAFSTLAALLRPGGTLVVLDLCQYSRASAVATAPLAFGLSAALRLWHHRRLRQPARHREVWEAHGQHDVYPTLADVRAAAQRHLPSARVRPHLLWRYSLTWRKPRGGDS